MTATEYRLFRLPPNIYFHRHGVDGTPLYRAAVCRDGKTRRSHLSTSVEELQRWVEATLGDTPSTMPEIDRLRLLETEVRAMDRSLLSAVANQILDVLSRDRRVASATSCVSQRPAATANAS